MKFRLTSGYMEEVALRDYRPHRGIDLAMPEGTDLRAIAEGTVDRVFDGTTDIGEGVSITLEDGSRVIYGHMSEVSVSVGDKVSPGELLGEAGATGHSTASHLHFAIKDADGEWIDPTPIAEDVADLSGDISSLDPFRLFKFEGGLTEIFGAGVKDTLREKTSATVTEMIYGALDALREVTLDAVYSVSLVGTGLLILAMVVGYTPARKYIGILFLANFVIKFLLGGYL